MARICPLFSGSSGNCTYIASKDGGILIDAGMSLKSIYSALATAGGAPDEIKAVAVTHEHIDHIKGLKALLSKTGAVLYTSEKTFEALLKKDVVPAGVKFISADKEELCTDGFTVKRFATSHDCPGSSGYTVTLKEGKKLAVCTDLGIITDEVRQAITGSDAVLIESNHDIEMLKKGPYPAYLKARILSEKGHISNVACAGELQKLLKSGTTRFILGHLSRTNNTPLLAKSTSEALLMDIGAQNGADYLLRVALPQGNGVTVL